MAKLGVFKRWLLDTETALMVKSQLFARVAKSTEASCSKFFKVPSSLASHPLQKTSTLLRPFLRSKNVPLKCKVAQFYQQNLSRTNYFRNDFLWRKARWRSCMFGLVGIGCFQEDLEVSRSKTDAQCERYQSVCDDVKGLCPVNSDRLDHLQSNQGVSLDSFKLGKHLLCHSDRSQYEAVLIDEEGESDDSVEDDVDSIISLDGHCSVEEQVPATTYYTPSSCSSKKEYIIDIIYNPNKCTVFPDYNENNISTTSYRLPKKSLPFHPNIASIERIFIDDYPTTPKEEDMWSSPSWSNRSCTKKPNTRSMFIVSKKPDASLKQYMNQTSCNLHTKSLIILQILEAVAHLERNNVAHRQIDVHNFVVETKGNTPRVLLTNFAEAFGGNDEQCFRVPFEHATLDTRLMGSTLQPPEIHSSVPGRGRVVNYSKSDAWNAGLLAFQILTNDPEGYMCYNATEVMNSVGNIPTMLKNIVQLLLQDDPAKRLSAAEAADILHLQLFAQPPSEGASLRICYKQIRSWMMAHYAEMFARKRNDLILHDVCRSFFNRMNGRGFFTSFKIWMLLHFGGRRYQYF